VSDEPIKICPECGGAVHRLIQPVGIIFKGSGFYVTDNRAKSCTSKPGTKKTEKQSEASTESKSTDTASTGADADRSSSD
jgi:predicted nucleic acid-binding Zn ribbon protein